MPAKKLRVLLVEASPDEARHTLTKLEKGGYVVSHERVNDPATMRAALAAGGWDLVLCSNDTAGFGGQDALNLLQEERLDLPFLFLSPPNVAVRGGSVAKDSLSQLAIEHALREARIRREHSAAQQALQENQVRLHAFIANLPGMAYQMLLNAHGDIRFPYVSEGSHALFDLAPHDLEQNPDLFFDMLHPDDRTSWQQAMQISADELSFWNWEGRVLLPPQNEVKWINLRSSPRKLAGGNVQWEGIMSNISQSRLAEISIKQSEEQLRELSSHIQDAREQERLRIAREIHDDMGGTLTAIKLDLAWLGNRLKTPEFFDKLKGIEALADRCLVSANNICRALRPSVLDSFGLVAAIEMEGEEFEKRTGISCIIACDEENGEDSLDAAIGPDISITLFRIFQETLTNIMKHAQATAVTVTLHSRPDGVDMTVKDNGRGLKEIDRTKPRSFGLRGIQERVAHFNGTVSISGAPGQGTTVSVRIPLATTQSEALPQQALF